jgi:hypothetical protein
MHSTFWQEREQASFDAYWLLEVPATALVMRLIEL